MSWFDMNNKTPWQKKIEKRTANIGFLTRGNALRDPTPAEKASAMAAEINSWQATKGKRPYTVSGEYSIPKGKGINLKADFVVDRPKTNLRVEEAVNAYIETPMEVVGKYAESNIDLEPYKSKGFFSRLGGWILSKFQATNPLSAARFSQDFMEEWGLYFKEEDNKWKKK